jgi:hypothetical protein
MSLHAAEGKFCVALHQYAQCRKILAAELGVKPAVETSNLAAEIRHQQEKRVDAIEPKTASPHNLPAELLTFFGRETEMARLNAFFFAQNKRLVTILGLGGMGKTRLALAFARLAVGHGRFPAGVFWVPLQQITTAKPLWEACAAAAGIRLAPNAPPLPQLIDALKERKLLLLLDNFEQLSAAAGDLHQLLAQTEHLQVLITSRARLPLQSSAVLQLHGLPFPDAAEEGAFPAVALLLDRYTQSRGAPPQAEALPALRRIARLSGGMPLALELAAAWGDTLSAAEIAAGLAADLSLLQADLQDIPARQREISGVFDASWQRLSAAEQALMCQLAFFGADFAQKDAEAITGTPPARFAGLVRKSFLQAERRDGRLRLHPSSANLAEKKAPSTLPHILRKYRNCTAAITPTFCKGNWRRCWVRNNRSPFAVSTGNGPIFVAPGAGRWKRKTVTGSRQRSRASAISACWRDGTGMAEKFSPLLSPACTRMKFLIRIHWPYAWAGKRCLPVNWAM